MGIISDLLENQNKKSSSKGGIQQYSKELRTHRMHNRLPGYAQNNPDMLRNACDCLVAVESLRTTLDSKNF